MTTDSQVRGLGIIRLSKSPDPASTSIPRQKEHIDTFASQNGITIVDYAIDKATSAFHIPPEQRKQVNVWLDKPGEYDCLIYWRQDRLVRRAADFMGLVTWCKANHKALYSATEGMGDVTQHAGVLFGFIKAWQAEGESQSTSDRVKDSQSRLAKEGRWRGGRLPYGARAVCVCHGRKVCPAKFAEGWRLEADTGGATYERCHVAIQRAIAGQSVNSIIADFNRRKIPATDGGKWKAATLWKILRNRALLDLGIVNAAEWSSLQTALKDRGNKRTVRTSPQASPLLDIVFCGKCGAKVYRWRRGKSGYYYGRCRNEIHRYEAKKPCDMPMIPYWRLEQLVSVEIAIHKDERVKEPVSNATVSLRLDDIAKELLDLLPEFMANQLDRDQFIARQTALMDEQESLQHTSNGKEWRETDETVGERWGRLSDIERRLWLLRIGTTYKLRRTAKGWELRGHLFEGEPPL